VAVAKSDTRVVAVAEKVRECLGGVSATGDDRNRLAEGHKTVDTDNDTGKGTGIGKGLYLSFRLLA
jgi:hypothetical protein